MLDRLESIFARCNRFGHIFKRLLSLLFLFDISSVCKRLSLLWTCAAYRSECRRVRRTLGYKNCAAVFHWFDILCNLNSILVWQHLVVNKTFIDFLRFVEFPIYCDRVHTIHCNRLCQVRRKHQLGVNSIETSRF
jgi:hypothetical protein